MATGTISGTGPTTPVAGTKLNIRLKFSGTGASIDVEEQMSVSGGWIKIDTAITADYHKIYDSPNLGTLRLNCTAYTSNSVEWSVIVN